METVQELITQHKGYKYLNSNGISPYQNYAYDLKSRRIMMTELDTDPSHDCGSGWNLATLKWISDNCLKFDGIIVECSIPKTAQIILPDNSNGKFRTDKIKIKKLYTIESLFPFLKDIKTRLKDYKPTNPIMAETMPEPNKIKKIMAQVGAQVGDQVRDQVWAQVGDQVGAQVGDQVRDQVGDQVRAQVGDHVWAQVGAQVWAQVGAQVGDQVRDQVWVCSYKTIADFFNIDYDHPAFELVRLGIMVVNILGKFKIFGKGGKYLGEVDSKKK